MMKICALALICVVVGAVIKQINNDVSFAIRALGGIMIFGILIISSESLIGSIRQVWLGDGGEYADVMVKALGVALLTHITAGVCRDCGENSIASGVELAGKLEILLLCVPIIVKILGYASALIELEV